MLHSQNHLCKKHQVSSKLILCWGTNKVHLEVDLLYALPGKIALSEPARDETMEEDGTIVKEDKHFP